MAERSVTDPYSEEDRQTALEVWAFEADRNAARTAELLAADHLLEIKPATIRKWASRYDWDAKSADLFRQLSPHHYERAAFTLMRAAPRAADYLLGVVSGKEGGEPAYMKAMIAAADSILNRTGFLPFSRTLAQAQAEIKQKETTAIMESSDPLTHLSDEELHMLTARTLSTAEAE